MKADMPEVRLERLVNALSDDLAAASDLELIEAANDLRMDLTMRGTAAFLGLKGLYFPYRPDKFPDSSPAGDRAQNDFLLPPPQKS
jgi:hypothetical protein